MDAAIGIYSARELKPHDASAPVDQLRMPGQAAYIWGGYANCANYPPVLKAVGLYFSQAIIWDKEHPVLTRKKRMGSRVKRVGFRWERGILLRR